MSFETTQIPEVFYYPDGNFRICITAKPSEELDSMLRGECDIRITPHKAKRSLSANAYAWVLIDKLAEALHKSSVEVYREAVKDIGGVAEYVCIRSEASPTMKKIWESKGIGWMVEELDSKIEGCINLKLTYGSSEYNTKQMSLLIDHLIQDCQSVGIETATPEQLKILLAQWGEQNG